MLQPAHPAHDRAFWQRFLLKFVGIGSAIVAAIYLYTYQSFHLHQHQLEQAEQVRLEHAASAVQRDLQEVIADLRRVSNSQTLLDFLNNKTPENRSRLEREFINLALYASVYDQVRLLDSQGMEQVRVNYQQGRPVAVPDDALQDKSDRYYFQLAEQLPAQQIYLSPLDLNIEHGVIEQPLKPMIRVAVPLYRDVSLAGVLVFNYQAAFMLERFEALMQGGWGEGMLVNAQGYWLYHRDPERRWGFILGHDARFDRDYPLAWERVSSQQSGMLTTREGQFIFITLNPELLSDAGLSNVDYAARNWKLVSWVKPALLEYSLTKSIQQNPVIYGGLLLITALLSYFLAWLRSSNILKTDALRESEASLNDAQHIAHMGNWQWDIASGRLRWSDEIYRIFGLRPQQFVPSYDAFMLRVHPDDRELLQQKVDAALNARQDYSFKHRILLPDKTIRYVHEEGVVTFAADGSPKHMVGTVQDITDSELARQQLQHSEEQIRSLVELAPDGFFVADLEGRYTEVNEAGCQLLGCERDDIIGKNILDFIHAEDVPRLEASKQLMLQGKSHLGEWRLRHKSGDYVPVEVSARILTDGRWQGVVRDISERKQVEEKLRQAAAVFDNTSEAIMVTDPQGVIVAVNQAYTRITGYEEQEAIGSTPAIHQSGRQDESFYQQLWQALETSGQWQGDIWNRRKNGEIYPGWENISAIRDETGQVINYVSVLSDISSLKEAESQLRHLAHHDPLTDLPNRMAFMANLEQALEHARRNEKRVALLFLDLDRFKLINDTLGHDVGDELLQSVAHRLKQTARGEDVVARLGGDEFTIIMEEVERPQDAAVLAQKIIQAIIEPLALRHHDISTSTSIGIGVFPDDAQTVSDLLKAADAAMYRAKNRGRNTYEYYTSELTQQALRRLSLENDLRQAIAQNEFELFYQPQVELVSGSIVGVEALLRWRHPELGLILPEQFIHVAEDSGLIDTVGSWVIRQAFSQARAWQKQGLPPVRVAVNVSGHQILYDGVLEAVQTALEQNDYRQRIVPFELEITESTLQSGHAAVSTLTQLRDLGVTIAIDDFGTGYSSLSQLRRLPIDTLKIDRAFLQQMTDQSDSKAIATAIISLGHSLGLKVIAEGVEHVAQLKFLKEEGCNEVQGFLISEPVSADRVENLIREGWQFPAGLSVLQ